MDCTSRHYNLIEMFIKVPDEHAEKLVTPALIAKYVADHQDS